MRNTVLYVVSTLSQSGPTTQLYNILSHLDRELWKPLIVTLSPEPERSYKTKFQDLNVDIVCLDLGRLAGALFAKSKLKKIIEKYSLTKICSIYFSPSFNDYSIKTLAEKIINDQLEVTLQNQFHKQIWGEIRGK